MAHLHTVQDDDLYFIIDANTKVMTPLSEDPPIVCQKDHNSEQVTFEIPRYIEGHDMLQCDKVEVHYINIAAASASQRNPGVYKITDLQVDGDNDNVLLCSWLVSQNATMFVGSLNFALRFECLTGSKIDYSWTTRAYSGIQVVETIDNADIIITQYPDVLEQWYLELLMSGTIGVNMVVDSREQAIADILAAKEETIDEIKNIDIVVEVEAEVLERIRTAGANVIEKIQNSESVELENKREKLIEDLLLRIPVYEGEMESMSI